MLALYQQASLLGLLGAETSHCALLALWAFPAVSHVWREGLLALNVAPYLEVTGTTEVRGKPR